MGSIFSRSNIIDLGRPSLLWLTVFVNMLFCITTCFMLLTGGVSFSDASGFLIVQVGGVTAPATAYVFQRSSEKRQESIARVEMAKTSQQPAQPINVEHANVTVETTKGAG